MSLKEFDYKQFLLEKGERLGLGIAVALMVLMLVWSLFMPSKGFFSGSPAAKAKELKGSTEKLETLLRTKQPSASDLPEKSEGRLIKLDTAFLKSDYYETAAWFEPVIKEDKMRRPPKILNVVEAVAEVAKVPIDTYIFRFDTDPIKVLILKKNGGGGQGLFRFRGNMPSMPGGGTSMYQQNMQKQLGSNPNALRSIQGAGAAADNAEYEPAYYDADKWDPQQDITARRLQPLRMTIIGGSFPYRSQLEEHKKKLKLASLDAAYNEQIVDNDKKQSDAFRFLGVDVQRMEVDAAGKPKGDWTPLDLKADYQVWLKATFLPTETEDPKYYPIRTLGLYAPLLREFHTDKPNVNTLQGGLMLPGFAPPAGAMQLRNNAANAQAEEDKPKTKYPDLVEKLPKLQETLENLKKVDAKTIAAPKFRLAEFANLFDLEAPAKNTETSPTASTKTDANQDTVYPEYVMVRVVDVNNIQPGKFYRYRLKIKMANPNYNRQDVAAPDYKEKEELLSNDWVEIKEIVSVPPELLYYVVDEAKQLGKGGAAIVRKLSQYSAQAKLLSDRQSPDQVAFQLHRWVENVRIKNDEVPIGDWMIADRVLVSRGEYVGRKARIDVPLWQYTRNAFILPTEEKPKKKGGSSRTLSTGIEVDFNQESPENNTILVDFEGGRVTTPVPDESAIEVLMLAPDGKLLVRNSIADTDNQDRKDRRTEVLKRIQETREGRGTE